MKRNDSTAVMLVDEDNNVYALNGGADGEETTVHTVFENDPLIPGGYRPKQVTETFPGGKVNITNFTYEVQ